MTTAAANDVEVRDRFWTDDLAAADPEIYEAVRHELERQFPDAQISAAAE
jgi:hypothetical protein